jgi:hypothetical protein
MGSLISNYGFHIGGSISNIGLEEVAMIVVRAALVLD